MKRKRRARHPFLLFPNLTLATEVLSQRSTLPEILWNFGRFKDARRLTLKENPHFYKLTDLPTSPEAYGDDFKTDPIDNFQHAKICVLTDKPGRLYLETDQNSRAFGNVWVPNNAIIFKGSRTTFLSTLPPPRFFSHHLLDVCGKLEGESIVQASIQGAHNLWYLEEPPLSPGSPQAVSPNRNTPPRTITTSTTNSTADGPFRDWREPIRQGLISSHADIRIRALSPNDSSPGSPTSSSAIGLNGCDDRSSPILRTTAQSSVHLTHRLARHTVTSQRLGSPLSKQSPRKTAPPSQTTHISSQKPPIASFPPKDQEATPTPVLAKSTSTPRDTSQRRELQDHALTGEVFLQKPDVRRSIHLTVTVASPPGETSPHILHIGDGGAKGRRKNPGRPDIRSSEQKGAAQSVPHPDSTPALLTQGLVGRVQKTAAWQFWSQMCNQAFQK